MALGRKTGGRQKGTRNKRTSAIKAKAEASAEAIMAVVPDAFDGDAHALLMAVYKNPVHPIEVRIDAAGKAIRYEKPALAQIDMQSEARVVHEVRGEPLSPEDRDREWIEEHGAAIQ